MKYLRTADRDSSTLSRERETMIHSQLCHQPAVILTWMHLWGKRFVQVVLNTPKLESGLKTVSEGMLLPH